MESKKLVIGKSPMHCYLHHAFTLNILFAYKQHIPWFFTNYIQTNWLIEYHLFSSGCLFEGIPFFDTQKIEIDFIKRNNLNIIDYIIDAINSDRYVASFFNEKYLSYRTIKRDFIHPIFIYGYDKTTKIFNMVGFNTNRIYGEVTASFDEVENSFLNLLVMPEMYTKYVYTIKTKENVKYEFDLHRTYDWLLDYLYSRDSTHKDILLEMKEPDDLYSRDSANKEGLLKIKEKNDMAVWGLDSYKKMKTYFKNILETGAYVDLKILHTLWEHKKAMQMRLEYMNQNKFIYGAENLIDLYNPVVEKSLKIKNLLVKYNITNDKRIIKSILEEIYFIEYQEQIILKKTLIKIQQNLYSEWILNSIVNNVQDKHIPLFDKQKYITVIYDCNNINSEQLISQWNNDLSNHLYGFIIKENKYKNILKNNNYQLKDNCIIIESENAENVYSKQFKSEYLNIYNADEESNISLITVNDIEDLENDLNNSSLILNLKHDFIIIYIKNIPLQMDNFECLQSRLSCYSIITPDDFFKLYRDRCGHQLNKSEFIKPDCNINSLIYSQQSGKCTSNNSQNGNYVTLYNNEWLLYKDIILDYKNLDYIVFYIDNIISDGAVQIVLNYLDGEIIYKCEICQHADGFQSYKCNLRDNQSTSHEKLINIYIKAVGKNDFQFNLYGLGIYTVINTNSYSINHVSSQKLANIELMNPVENNICNYQITLKNSGCLLYEDIEFDKNFCELELEIENGIDGDIIEINLENKADAISIKNKIIIRDNHKKRTLFTDFSSLHGKYNILIRYKSKNQNNIIKLNYLKCGIDIFKEVKGIEYSSCKNIQPELLQGENGDYTIAAVMNNSYVKYDNINFYKKITTFNVFTSGEAIHNNGILEIRIDNVDGTLIGECEVKTTGHWLSYKQYTCNVDNVEGRHDLYIIFKGIENYYLVNMKAFWFE